MKFIAITVGVAVGIYVLSAICIFYPSFAGVLVLLLLGAAVAASLK